jgi:hypothetical protein
LKCIASKAITFAILFNNENKYMKKIFVGLFLLVATFAQSQTADEILAKYETASGGREKLQDIKMLEVLGNVKMGVMGQNIDLPVTLVREKGKLFRRQIGGVMGMSDSFTMLTDTSGYIYIPGMRGFGGGRGDGGGGGFGGGPGAGQGATISRMKPEEITAEQYELDSEGPFPELVNSAAKGHTALLMGTDKVNKVPCYKIKMTLKTGQVATYYFDTQTFLVKQVEATGEMAANLTGFGPLIKAYGSNLPKDTKAKILVKDYGEFKGIKYPTKYNLSYGPIESEVENLNVQINEGLEEKWYHVKP